MYRTANQTTSARRRIGVLVLTGAASGLITLAAGAGSADAAAEAFRRAIELTTDQGVAGYLREQLTSLELQDTHSDTPVLVGGQP